MSEVFQLSDALSSDLVGISPEAEKTHVLKWMAIDAEIQTLLTDQPSLSSVIQNKFKTTFTDVTEDIEPAHLLIVSKSGATVQSDVSTVPPPQFTNVIDTVIETLRDNVFPSYSAATTTLIRAGDSSELGIDIARFELFVADIRRYLGSYIRLQTADFWLASTPLTGTRSRKDWLITKLRDVLRAECEMLNFDNTLTPEQVQVVDLIVRYPSLSTRAALAAYSRPAVYALALKGQSGLAPVYFAGAFVMTARDGSGVEDQFGAFTIAPKGPLVEIDYQANAGVVVLYTPSGGLQGFSSLQTLQAELERRWRAVTEFESMLELTSSADLPRIMALENGPQATLELFFSEIKESVFEHWFKVHDEQRQQNLIHILSHAATANGAELEGELAHVIDYAHRFRQASAFSARVHKHLSKKTRDWLVKANSEDRARWLEAAEKYKTQSLLANEDGEPSPHQFGDKAFLLRYAREHIQQHIQLEYGIHIDPDTLFITTTAAEAGSGPVIPVSGFTSSSYTSVNSLSRTGPSINMVSTSRTMTQLSLENVSKFDVDYALTARISTGSATGPRSTQLSASQVKNIIRTVNIGDNYQAFLQDKLIDSPRAVSRRETAMQLMIAQMRMDALEAKISKDFSPDRLDRGYRWVEAVLDKAQQLKPVAEVEGHTITVYQLLIDGATVRGVLIIGTPALAPEASWSSFEWSSQHPQFSVSSLVVYTPEAPDGKRFREFENRAHFANKFLHDAAFAEYLSGRVSMGHQTRVSQLLRQGLRAPDVKLLVIADNFIEQGCIAQARHAIANADALSNSTSEVNELTVWNSIEMAVDIVTFALPLKATMPIALGRSLLSLWNGFDALKRDSQLEALRHFLGMVAHWVDASVDLGVAVIKLPNTGVVTSPPALDPKLAYTKALTDLTLRTDGAYAGVYEKVPKQGGYSQYFIQQEKHWYQLKYDKDRLVWRVIDMRRPQAWYRSPISKDSEGIWRVSTPELSLLGGGPSTLAPFRVRVAFPNLSLEEARRLLDQYNFPEGRRAHMELAMAEYLVKHKELPLWSHAYLKPGLEAARQARLQQPQDTSNVLLSNKRKAPEIAQEQPVARPLQPGSSTSTPQSGVSIKDSWKSWGQNVEPGLSSMASINPPIFKVTAPERTYRAIKIDDLHYEILPQGLEAQTNRVLLVNPHKPCKSFQQLEKLIRENKYFQPRLAEFANGNWTIKEPFFYKPLSNFVRTIFPSMTAQSRIELARRLFRFADPGNTELTTSRMLNINQTLYGWITKSSALLSVHLGDPFALLAHGPRIGERIYNVGTKVSAGMFSRMDFVLLASEHALITRAATALNQSLNDVMKSLLQRLGYEIYPGVSGYSHLVFRRRGSKTLNFMQLHKTDSPLITMTKALTDSLEELISENPLSPLSLALSNARTEGKLVFLIGGLQQAAPSDLPVGFVYRV